MPNADRPDLSLFLDILRTLERIGAAAPSAVHPSKRAVSNLLLFARERRCGDFPMPRHKVAEPHDHEAVVAPCALRCSTAIANCAPCCTAALDRSPPSATWEATPAA